MLLDQFGEEIIKALSDGVGLGWGGVGGEVGSDEVKKGAPYGAPNLHQSDSEGNKLQQSQENVEREKGKVFRGAKQNPL